MNVHEIRKSQVRLLSPSPRISSFPEAHQFVCHCASQVGSMDPDRAVGHHLSDGQTEREIAGNHARNYIYHIYVCMYKHSVDNNSNNDNNNINDNNNYIVFNNNDDNKNDNNK